MHIFTRKSFVGYNGATFDPEPERRLSQAKTANQLANSGAPVQGFLKNVRYSCSWEFSEAAHNTFNQLSGVKGGIGNRGDLISQKVFNNLCLSLQDQSLRNIETLANKRIAHSASMISRGASNSLGISFADIERAHCILISSSSYILSHLLYERDLDIMPDSTFDWRRNFDDCGLNSDQLGRIALFGKRLAARYKKWATKPEMLLFPKSQRINNDLP
ncbi:hypothetical protein [Arboricoccus pini]|uniref:hypothetical protein n=1 Tax=Arboricoccus pini TaxID=1963835 RepID=UPI0010560D3D|nr:hypothetical protein [Arboricoccus pini]